MKNLKKVLALVLAVAIMMSIVVTASAKDYSDVKGDTNYADAIDALSGLGILDGFTDGSFQPEGTLTRAQAAKIVAIVHNAATNKKIQSDIADLYKNAQNSFVDCNGSWALPYINYCRITGLADGMTATTYEPNRVLTGVQFLKLMLTTLGFDTAKEGYTGTGWDINVLNRANEIGLTAGLADGWQGIKELKRGEAAQILYNALTKYIVEYGQLIKIDSVAGTYKNAFVSNEHVAQSGYTLGGKMGITIARGTDDYRRPGYAWSYGSWKAFYIDTPVATYTTAVTECDILKALGVAETKTTPVTLDGVSSSTKTTAGKLLKEAALNYYAVDGFKYTTLVMAHDRQKDCQKTRYLNGETQSWKTRLFGGQGDLTQVFKTEDGVVITTVHTFLGSVYSVVKNNKFSHAGAESSTIKVWIQGEHENAPVYGDAELSAAKGVSTTAYAANTMVLVTLSFKDTEAANLTGSYTGNTAADAYIVETAAAESKTGKLTGASDVAYTGSVSIDGTKYFTNCRFVLGKDDATKFANWNKAFTFYFDTNGNVIGCTDVTTAASYVVMDRIYGTHENGKFVVKADLVDLEGKALTNVTVAQAASFDGVKDGYGEYVTPGTNYSFANKTIYMVDSHNDANLINGLYTYTADADGVYTLTWVGQYTNEAGYGRLDGKFTHVAKLAYLAGAEVYTDSTSGNKADSMTVALSESTKFIVKSVGGEWTTYTGYTALPALTATYVDYVDNDGDTFADVVYIGNATFAGDSITGWVTNWGRYNWANGYDLVTVYVKGEPVVVNVLNPLGTKDSNNENLESGMYTFEIGKDKSGVAYATAIKKAADYSGVVTTDKISADTTAIKVKGAHDVEEVIGLTNVEIYEVKEDGTVVKADASAIVKGDYVEYFAASSKGSAPYGELYIIDSLHQYV